MKIYLDDERATPEGWVRTLTSYTTIELLKCNEVSHLSLDHDLGSGMMIGTGYDVLLWLEEQVARHQYKPPKITIHSANISARVKMELAVQQIEKLHNINVGRSTGA